MADTLSNSLLKTLNAARAQDEASKELTQEGAGLEYHEDEEEFLPSLNVVSKKSKLVDTQNSDDTIDDFQHARNVTYACQDMMVGLIENAAKLAITTENPRAFDNVNNLVGTLRGLNKDLIEFNKMTLESKSRNTPPAEGETKVNVNEDGSVQVHQGRRTSTRDLLAKIEEARRNGTNLEELDNQAVIDSVAEEVEDGESSKES
ncbi:terminase small subunit [Vibrio phage VP-1]|uniref:Terminase small subunit n=1 Tax=Vibrio phage VP-1 TaxID=2234088 RepID=A0A4P2TEY2_9CAUD|nr:terminase small subunit [Vibrio phage VP-1]